jgi:RNA polymerase sigma factor (TIGR02999 family)
LHEAYLRLVDIDRMDVRNRTHLLALSGRLMRQVLVDAARRRRSLKRGGDAPVLDLDDVAVAIEAPGVDLIDLDRALDELMTYDLRLCQVVELKFFAGCETSEIARTLSVSTATVERDWTVARAWLYDRLMRAPGGAEAV